MKKLLATTAIALMTAAPVIAQESAAPPAETGTAEAGNTGVLLFLSVPEPNYLYASNLIGMDVYSSQTDYAGTYGGDRPVAAADSADWDDIGEVNDIVMTPDGQARGVLVDIGGFLGMGEHTVALDMSQVHLLRDETNRRFVAVNSSREQLENAPEFERPAEQPITAADPGMGNTGTMGATDGTGMAPGTAMGTRPAFEREGYMTANYDDLTAEQLQGAAVYDAQDQSIGEVDRLILSPDGKITQAVVDIGGFLGIGEHPVALAFDEMQVMTNSDNSEVRVYIDQSREALEQRPEYEGQ